MHVQTIAQGQGWDQSADDGYTRVDVELAGDDEKRSGGGVDGDPNTAQPRRSSGDSCRGVGLARHGRCAGSIANDMNEAYLIDENDDDLQHAEQNEDDQWKYEGELDGGLPAITSAQGRRDITLSITWSNKSPILPAPPPPLAQATTRSAMSAAARMTSAYSDVAWPVSDEDCMVTSQKL